MVPWSLITSYFSVPILYHYMHLPTESRNLFFSRYWHLQTGTKRAPGGGNNFFFFLSLASAHKNFWLRLCLQRFVFSLLALTKICGFFLGLKDLFVTRA
jgi:hypothetical protein